MNLNNSLILKSSLLGTLLTMVLFFPVPERTTKTHKKTETLSKLNTHCPPGFKKNENNECITVNLYQQYDSPNNKGVGGMQTSLPEIRDGFSPQQIDLGRYLFFDP